MFSPVVDDDADLGSHPFIRNVRKAGDYFAKPGIPRVQRQTVEGQTFHGRPTVMAGVLERCFSGSA